MLSWAIAAVVAAMLAALAAWLLRRYRVSIEPTDELIDDLIRRKGAGADPLYRPGVIVFTKPIPTDGVALVHHDHHSAAVGFPEVRRDVDEPRGA